MADIRRWFVWLIVILVVHGAEQFVFGIDELYEVQRVATVYYSWFSNPDYGKVALIGGVVLIVQLFLLMTTFKNRCRLVPFGFFGIAGIFEIHHILKTLLHRAYFPGAVTAIPYAVVGALLLRAVFRQWKQGESRGVSALAASI
jgi:hypothetical protein